MIPASLLAGIVGALATAVCGAAAAEAVEQARGAPTDAGGFYVEYVSKPSPIPLNEIVTLEVRTFESDRSTPAAGAVVTASAFMPAHGHGTTIQPRVASRPDGSATVTGLLLHMPGHWELRFGVARGGRMERVKFDVSLE